MLGDIDSPVSVVPDTTDPFLQYLIVLLLLLLTGPANMPTVYAAGKTTRIRITMLSISGHQQRGDEAARWVRAEMIKRVARELKQI